MTSSDLRRFLGKIRIGDGCWEWQASKNRGGYGRPGMTAMPSGIGPTNTS